MRASVIILLIFVSNCCFSQIKKTRMLYAFGELASPQQMGVYNLPDPIAYNVSLRSVQWSPSRIRTPALGIGFMSMGRLFLKASLAYWYEDKTNGYDSYSYSPNPEFNPIYMETHDHFDGRISMHHINADLSVGIKLFKGLAIFAGYKKDYLVGSSFKGEMFRQVITYNASSGNFPLQTYGNFSTYKNNQAKNKSTQVLTGGNYLVLGFNYLFEIKEKPCFVNLSYAHPIFDTDHNNNYSTINLSVGFPIINFVKVKKEDK